MTRLIVAIVVASLVSLLLPTDSFAVSADVAKTMCEGFHEDKPAETRQRAIDDCLKNLTIDSPAPRFPADRFSIDHSWWKFFETASYGIMFLVVIAVIYFVPAVVAFSRRKINRVAILILNIFLGWTFVGWVLALVWAATPRQQRIPSGHLA